MQDNWVNTLYSVWANKRLISFVIAFQQIPSFSLQTVYLHIAKFYWTNRTCSADELLAPKSILRLKFTLQLNLVFRTVNQHGADCVQIVIVAASERPGSCFSHLEAHEEKTVLWTLALSAVAPVFTPPSALIGRKQLIILVLHGLLEYFLFLKKGQKNIKSLIKDAFYVLKELGIQWVTVKQHWKGLQLESFLSSHRIICSDVSEGNQLPSDWKTLNWLTSLHL